MYKDNYNEQKKKEEFKFFEKMIFLIFKFKYF